MIQRTEIMEKGHLAKVPLLQILNTEIVITGHLLKIARIKDEEWLDNRPAIDIASIIRNLAQEKYRPDIFTFSQSFLDPKPKYPYKTEWDNIAAIPISTPEDWLKSTGRTARKAVTQSIKNGVQVYEVKYNDDFISQLVPIYNETAVRQGKHFWHFGKDFEAIKSMNATFMDRSIYLGAYINGELIGFLKIVYVDNVGRLIQFLGKIEHRKHRPMNALIAKAVDICFRDGLDYLTYGRFIYGNTRESSLMDFKRHNGFIKMDFPLYYVPITTKGRMALQLGMHHGIIGLFPNNFIFWFSSLRKYFYTVIKVFSKY